MKKSRALKSKLQAAINERKNRMEEVSDYIDFLKGKQYKKKPGKDDTTFNICHTTVQAILNSILRGNSHIYVDPASKEAVQFYENVEKVINYWWKKINVKYQVELSTTDYAALGLGVSYVDWDVQKSEDGKVIKDEPFVLHIPYEDFLIDPRATTEEIYDAEFMARRFIMPTKKLKKDSRYKQTKNIVGDVKLSSDIYKDRKLSECTRLYRIWVKGDNASYVMREESDDILRTVENKSDDYPFVIMQNYKMPGELFPFGDVKILYEPQKMLNKIYSLILTHARRVSTRQFAANDRISKEEKRKLRDARDGEILNIEGNDAPDNVIKPIQDASLSADVYRAYDLVSKAIVQLSSISEYRRSMMPQDQRKATEATFIEQGTELSVSAKAEDVAKHCEEISRKLFKLITREENLNTNEITFKDEKTGEWNTLSYNGASFPGEYAFRWESGVEGPVNKASRQQKTLGMLETIANITRLNPQIAQTLNWKELLKTSLAPFELKNIDEILTPEQMPEQMEQTEQAMQQEQQGQPNQPPQPTQPGQPGQQVNPEVLDRIVKELKRR